MMKSYKKRNSKFYNVVDIKLAQIKSAMAMKEIGIAIWKD
jgi:hypothetical protein